MNRLAQLVQLAAADRGIADSQDDGGDVIVLRGAVEPFDRLPQVAL